MAIATKTVIVDGQTYIISKSVVNNEWKPGYKYYYYLTLGNSLTISESVVHLNVTPFTAGQTIGNRVSGDNYGNYIAFPK